MKTDNVEDDLAKVLFILTNFLFFKSEIEYSTY